MDLVPEDHRKKIKTSLLFVFSQEVKAAVRERKNKRGSIRRVLSGNILRKYKLIKYAAKRRELIEENRQNQRL